MLCGIYSQFDSRFNLNLNRNARFNLRFDSNSNGRFAGPYISYWVKYVAIDNFLAGQENVLGANFFPRARGLAGAATYVINDGC